MRNQTKIAVVASILVFILGVSWYVAEWDHYSHRSVLVTPAEYETVEKSSIEKVGSTIMATIFCFALGVGSFALVGPKDIWGNGI